MAQYQLGSILATNGSAVITAVDPDSPNVLAQQKWLAEVAIGDLFYVSGEDVVYVVQSINSDIQLTLSSAYQGTTIIPAGVPLLGASYAIHRDFTTNYAFPLVSQGDIGIPVMVKLVTIDLDTELKAIDDRVVILEP